MRAGLCVVHFGVSDRLDGYPVIMNEPPERALEARAARMFNSLLAATHLSRTTDVSGLLAEHAQMIGAAAFVLYLVDYEQAELKPLPGPVTPTRSVLDIEGTLAGRCFREGAIPDVEGDTPGVRRFWVPLLDGTERLGVVEILLEESADCVDPAMVEVCERLAHLAAQLIVTKGNYGDAFELVRRGRPMAVAAELQWSLLPPLVFATPGLVIAGLLEPAYDAGGDSFDYAVDGSTAHFAVIDAMGHGLAAALTANLAVASYRSARRRLLDLSSIYAEVDSVVGGHFGGERYATGVIARLDFESGLLTWINAGHPPALLLRSNRFVKFLDSTPNTPLGMQLSEDGPVAAQESLEPGDLVLFYTDGLTEARTDDGGFFTVERLAEFVEKEAAAGLPAPETLRRLRHAVLKYQNQHLQDDATALLVEWRRDSESALLPRTV